MANFPTTIDELDSPSTDPDNPSYEDILSHAAQHANANSAIMALETKVGADGSTDADSHDFKLSSVASGDKASSIDGAETLTNKDLTDPSNTFPELGRPLEPARLWSD